MTDDTHAPYPLAGIKVVELSRILAGPFCGQILADLGAEVVKIESPEGDDTRRWGPPFIKDQHGQDKDAAYFHGCNRGKRSVVLDLKTEFGQKAAIKLAEEADILIENFKVGGLKKYALDYEGIRKINPAIIYCSVTGFGQDGPYASRAGYDFIIQAMGGFMELTGEADGEPQKAGIAYSDVFTGAFSAIGIQSALIHRMKTGEGQHIDMALLDSQVGVLVNQAMSYFATGKSPKRMGNAHQVIVPYQVFEVSDGHLIIAVGNDTQFERLCVILDMPALSSDPSFKGNSERVKNRESLVPILAEKVREFRRDDLLAKLEAATVPGGPINRLDDVFEDPQIIHRQMLHKLPAKSGPDGEMATVRTPIKFSKSQLRLETASPELGEHTDEILGKLGLKNEE